jgi:chromosome segregation ATPase
MADTQQPASRESVMRLEQRVEQLDREVREDRANLYSKVNNTCEAVAVLTERTNTLKDALAGLHDQCGRIEQKLDDHRKADEGRRESDQAARTGRLWMWLVIIAGWLFGLLQMFFHKPNGG